MNVPLRKFVLETLTVLVLFQSCSRTVVPDICVISFVELFIKWSGTNLGLYQSCSRTVVPDICII